MKAASILFAAAMLFGAPGANADMLAIDFNSTTQDDGPHNQAGFQPYDAGHEVAADFTPKSYAALGTTVTVTPAWPNTTDNRVEQMIDRDSGFDASWDDAAGDLDLVTDWIGIDTRTGSGGKGNWDGTRGTPTYMTITLSGLSAGTYEWTSYHHDTEHVHGDFRVELSVDGATFAQLADGYMSDGSAGGKPDSTSGGFPGPQTGPDAHTLISTYTTSFNADGAHDVVFRFAPYANTDVHRQIWGMNGFVVTPEPSSLALLMGAALLGVRRRRCR